MSCVNPDVLDFCPTQADLQPQLLAMLPRGRAFGEGGPGREPGGIIYQFWWAIAGLFAALHAQICLLALEFVCQTADFTLDLWLQEYGLPDGCDPFPDLCAKVAAIGGATCDYYQAIAASLGWSITCGTPCSTSLGCFAMGLTPLGMTTVAGTLLVAVDLANSPAYDNLQGYGIRMGCYRMAFANTCGPDLRSLDCLLERIVGAHLNIVYVLV